MIKQRPAIHMTWENLLFLHFSCPAESIAPLMPPGLELDTFPDENGTHAAWIGLVAFHMLETRPPFLVGSPKLGLSFPETNVRTYVRHGADKGVYFFSLDAASQLAVNVAKVRFHLPYFRAQMRLGRKENTVTYQSERPGNKARCVLEAEISGEGRLAAEGSLEHFLLERYLFMTSDPKTGAIRSGLVAHKPYVYRQASPVLTDADGIICAAGIEPRPFTHHVFSDSVEVVGYKLA